MAKLTTKNLTKHFGGLVAVQNVSFSISSGEILGIIGPNGAGKTTFINLISGIYMPSSGTIEFEGVDISLMPACERAKIGIARTYQLIHPMEDLNLIENIMVGFLFAGNKSMKEARRLATELCESMGLRDLDREVSQLTMLEVKKMEIAHAMANTPKLLFLDEIMAGLNSDETKEMIALVKRLAKERDLAVGVVEHVMGVIRELTDRVIVLESGEIIAEGPYETVSKDKRVIEAYLGGTA
ncbi:MAG: ABC transporter ATP-binding protein [Spirochaetaceae bacterium]|nr:ABC transporter ATP-binding protein [Spirochaetaceae bacterium]